MTFSVLKRSTAACWAAFSLSQAEHLIRGAEMGSVWGCERPTIAPLPDEKISVSTPTPTLCIPKQENQAQNRQPSVGAIYAMSATGPVKEVHHE